MHIGEKGFIEGAFGTTGKYRVTLPGIIGSSRSSIIFITHNSTIHYANYVHE